MKVRILVVGIVAAAACLVAAGSGIADTTNTDPTGDAKGGAPDITQVVTTNDASGTITFRITTVAPLIDTSEMLVALDTDSNPGTGAGGAEYLLIAGTGGFGIGKWNGTTFAAASAPSLTMTRSANVLEFKINRSDIGVTDRFGFSVITANFDAATDDFLGEDDAPDGGEYVYAMVFAQCANGKDDDGDGKIDGNDLGCSSPTDNRESDDPVTLKASKAVTVPAKPKAGNVVVGAAVLRLETGAGIPSGTVRCAARVGTKALPGSGRVASGVAACKFTLPKTSKGKLVHGTIAVTFKAKTVTVPFSFKVT